MELSLPARDLSCAITAFENGADSVYFGFEKFSARAGAENFSIDGFRRLRRFSRERGKKIFLALNTILNDDEMREAFRLLSAVSLIGCDGVMVQDWGVVRMVKECFPSLPLHASTQMAVQNSSGVQALKRLGFSRVVLARELSLDEIAAIREENPDIELKVFVHGALCYCVSGLCYASKMLLGEGSANKGSCRQPCRFAFKGSDGTDSHPFSLKDLVSDASVIERLRQIGIDSIKVEGRLKGESYVKWAARYYRALLNRDSKAWTDECLERMRTAFSRDSSAGYFHGSELGEDGSEESGLALEGYQGHRGVICGRFIDPEKVLISSTIRKHDGLMVIGKDGKPRKFANSKRAFKRGETAMLAQITDERIETQTHSGLWKIKDSRDNAPSSSGTSSLPLDMVGLRATVVVGPDGVSVSAILPFGASVRSFCAVRPERARSDQDARAIIRKAFSRKGNWCEVKEIGIVNSTGMDDGSVFLPSSAMKELAVDFFRKCEEETERFLSRDLPPVALSGEFKIHPDTVLPPLAFARGAADPSLFVSGIVEINNVCDLLPLLEKSVLERAKGVVLGPYLNIANCHALSFFAQLFADKLVGAVSFVEGGVDHGLRSRLLDGEEIFSLRAMPFFIKRQSGGRHLETRLARPREHVGR